MTSATRTMAACLADAERGAAAEFIAACSKSYAGRMALSHHLLAWQRAKACLDQREAMQIVDDKTLDELNQLEHEARLAARSACEAVGIEWRMFGDLA